MPSSPAEPRAPALLGGAAEVALGALLLVPAASRRAARGPIAPLLAVFPANVFMCQHAERFGIAPALLLARLPVQGLLIAWAWAYTGRPARRPGDASGARAR